uniref:Uncharacterized protein LOC111115864 n=1 Tax=Crassostrea virginica TaxID=6565 RepID=A0A8B8C6F9_CRAVI|nr:uncharacterized protein LOC111115864 [Crassostrea virginica]
MLSTSSSLAATVLLAVTIVVAVKVLDESTFNWILTTAHDRVQEAFISATPFLPRWGVIDETVTYIGLCFLAVLSFVLCWLLSLLCTKLLTYLWAGVSTLIEFVVSVVVFFFSSLSSAVVIQIIKCSIVPILAVLAYFYWDQLVSLLSSYK